MQLTGEEMHQGLAIGLHELCVVFIRVQTVIELGEMIADDAAHR